MRGKRNRKWVKEDEWDERGEKKVEGKEGGEEVLRTPCSRPHSKRNTFNGVMASRGMILGAGIM